MNNEHQFGAEICSDICPRTLPVPRSEQFSESVEENGGYCVYYIYHIDIPGFRWRIFGYMTRLEQSSASENI